MKSFNTYYTDVAVLESFIKKHTIKDSPSLLIQVFTAVNDIAFIETLLKNLTRLLPNAVIIGATTDGEIMDGKVSTHKTVLNFTRFEHTQLKADTVIHQKDGFFSGQYLAKSLVQNDTKLIIAFVDGLHTNGEAFLKGMHSVHSEIVVAGGLAGDNATFTQTYVFTKEAIVTHGAVGVALNSARLNVYNDYSFNWRCIGKELTITKVEDNRVFMIDDKTAVDTYGHYLGDEVAEELPAVGIELPLITTRNGIKIARAVLAKHDDGSLSFAGNFNLGEKVQFGYGDSNDILDYSNVILTNVMQRPSEVIFVYSCMARRHFMPDLIETEVIPLQKIAPVAGFFTYGEFFTSKEKELLNQSMTVLSLSESDKAVKPNSLYKTEATKYIRNTTNALIHLINITSHEAMEQETLRQAQSTFETLFEKAPDGILLIEKERFVQCNQKMIDIFGYHSEEEFLQIPIRQIYPKKQPDGSHSLSKMKEMRDLALKEGRCQLELRCKKANGETFWTDIMLTSMVLNGRDVLYLVCRDISQRKEMELELSHQKSILYYQANHDELTGLPNRILFSKEIQQSIVEHTQNKKEFALLFFDLDRFKGINDSLGHNIGDKVLQIIANRLKESLRKNSFISRLGGDEFVVILKDIKSNNDIVLVAQRILNVVKEPISIGNHTLYTSASIGISICPKNDMNAQNLLKYADAAMYKAKDEGGNNYQFYANEMTKLVYEQVIMERDLREGIKNDELVVYYQPVINAVTNEIIGVEALIRWYHPRLGILSPDMFIPLSKKAGMVIELDLWVMKTAMRDVSSWYAEGLQPGFLALNLTMRQLEYPPLIQEMKDMFHIYNFKAQWLELEITESEMMKKPDEVISLLKKLNYLGIGIAIDDFGTGYSSLSYLKHLPIDKLKIDKSFIKDIPQDEDAVVIVKTIIALATSLHLDVIAEGVEQEEQKEFLVAHGCRDIQGYYYSKPLSSKDMKAMFEQKRLKA